MARSPTKRRAGSAGFTLLELMIVVAIIGILSAVAYPGYTRYVVKAHRTSAQVHMMELAQAQSRMMADSRAYAASVAALGMSTSTAISDKYTIAIKLEDGPPSAFTITAKPVAGSSQAGDGDLAIDSAGTRTPAGKW
ncbi:type IV pilin protein [Massilia jejuensis]|uniref:Type IV pilin protein n=1 Tax=Massilia jejuensis TaxID=648894 RepID=A0ABW0PIL9_9BURK